MQFASLLLLIILLSVACLDVSYLPHYFINGKILGEEELLNINYVFRYSLELLCEIFLIIRRNRRGIIISVRRSACKVP